MDSEYRLRQAIPIQEYRSLVRWNNRKRYIKSGILVVSGTVSVGLGLERIYQAAFIDLGGARYPGQDFGGALCKSGLEFIIGGILIRLSR